MISKTKRKLKNIKNKILYTIRKPKIKIDSIENGAIQFLGSKYGGWNFLKTSTIKKSTVISIGAGEDISFDVMLADQFDTHIILVDPTPKSIIHIEETIKSIGKSASTQFNETGRQEISSYPLENIQRDQILHEKSALWTHNGHIKFFQPPNPNDVSHSITNIQNNYKSNSENNYINVPCVTIEKLFKKHNITEIEILKIDIEGAEIHVIPNILKLHKSLQPKQILVEYDGILYPNKKYIKMCLECDDSLRKNGYTCIHKHEKNNFLYVKHECIERKTY
ncbi:FkbM family methyltransferase [uncultured Thalassospira sp.]|uniref:FkbM family methyltransferase n=1 Tax=uncultured Thalassospira sp. TaxID=404382 RepID=UPI0030DB1ED4|tara:strand:+ start:3803 stop:4639 length:837 start_codon:yes stop_codon:yes gene_type:complete